MLFRSCETSEAKFANTVDKIQPAILNDIAGGKSWREHGVDYSQVIKRNEQTAEGSEILWDYTNNIFNKNVQTGNIKK